MKEYTLYIVGERPVTLHAASDGEAKAAVNEDMHGTFRAGWELYYRAPEGQAPNMVLVAAS